MEQMSLVSQSKTVFNILFCTMVSHPVANQTLLKHNDNLVTKHMGTGYARLAECSTAASRTRLPAGIHVNACLVPQNKIRVTLKFFRSLSFKKNIDTPLAKGRRLSHLGSSLINSYYA